MVGTRRVYGRRPGRCRFLGPLRAALPASSQSGIASTLRPVSISTKRGDDGTTGLFYGGRVRKDSARVETTGAIDEAQAALGLARAEVRGSELDDELQGLERGLWVVMAEVATAPSQQGKACP